jgi:hypothetical protein
MGARQWAVTGLAVLAAALTLAMTAVYVSIMSAQGEAPLAWVLAVLVLGVLLALYGALVGVPARRVALFCGGSLLVALGVLAIFSIGLPLLLGGVALMVAGALASVGDPA